MSEQNEAIVPMEPEVRLGSLGISDPTQLVKRASELATALAEIINKQELYSIITNKKTGKKLKYVKCEGWTTMGAMLGVVPIEDYCRPLPEGRGFEAKINLIRVKDGGLVGAASAECTHDENQWATRDSYSLRSMALTRATSKAFRLSFSWVIKLAGFEATPAEEMMGNEDASVTRVAVETEIDRQKAATSLKTAPLASNGHSEAVPQLFFYFDEPKNEFTICGDKPLMEANKELLLYKGKLDPKTKFVVFTPEAFEDAKFELGERKISLRRLSAAPLVDQLKTSLDAQGGKDHARTKVQAG